MHMVPAESQVVVIIMLVVWPAFGVLHCRRLPERMGPQRRRMHFSMAKNGPHTTRLLVWEEVPALLDLRKTP